jgi:hypothetical protein
LLGYYLYMKVGIVKEKVSYIGDGINYDSVVALSFEMIEWP